jgi:hypothetical protein
LQKNLTFDMRSDRKAQPFGHPLDGRVRAHITTAGLHAVRMRDVDLPSECSVLGSKLVVGSNVMCTAKLAT